MPLLSLWSTLRRQFLEPRVSDQELDEQLSRIHAELPVPVIWLFGKSQAGKTSIIRALTGSTQTEIGNGFKPCTRTAQLYEFPNEEECFLKFLDTRGLGEVDYDPSQDIAAVEKQAHLMIVVVRAMDHALKPVLDPLEEIRRTHPHWPIIVAQSSLHDGYPPGRDEHPQPYAFDQFPYPPSVPVDLARSLAAQREKFSAYKQVKSLIPIDFTLPEDGMRPQYYGLEQLWKSIEDALPLGLRGMLQNLPRAQQTFGDAYLRAAQPHVISYAIAAGAAAAFPVPMVDLPLVLSIQAKMFHTLSSIYGQSMSKQRMGEVLSVLGIGYAVRLGGRGLLKVIPGIGSAAAAIYTSATTYALGRTLCFYFHSIQMGSTPDTERLRKLYREQFQIGRQHLQQYFQNLSPDRSEEPS